MPAPSRGTQHLPQPPTRQLPCQPLLLPRGGCVCLCALHMWLVLEGQLQGEEIWNLKPLQVLPEMEPNLRPWRMEALAGPGPVTSSLGSVLVARRPSSSLPDAGGVCALLWALVPQPEMASRPLRALQSSCDTTHVHGEGPHPLNV